MASNDNKSLNLKDIEDVKEKLENFLDRTLSSKELESFDKLIDSRALVEHEKSSPSFFKETKEPDIQGLADALEDIASENDEMKPDWTFSAGWTYHL